MDNQYPVSTSRGVHSQKLQKEWKKQKREKSVLYIDKDITPKRLMLLPYLINERASLAWLALHAAAESRMP